MNLHPLKKTEYYSVHTVNGSKIVSAIRYKGVPLEESTNLPGTYEIGTVNDDGELEYHIIVLPNGFTGVGAAEPTAKLHVHGTVRLSDIPGEGDVVGINEEGYLYRTTGGETQVQSDWDEDDAESPAYILNKPDPLQGETGNDGSNALRFKYTEDSMFIDSGVFKFNTSSFFAIHNSYAYGNIDCAEWGNFLVDYVTENPAKAIISLTKVGDSSKSFIFTVSYNGSAFPLFLFNIVEMLSQPLTAVTFNEGDVYSISYALIGKQGEIGDAGDDGREVELQVDSGYVQWRYIGEATWTNLIALTTLTGPTGDAGADGEDGREVELQVDSGYVQWRYIGEATWTNLIALTTLTGPAGDAGADGEDGREIELQVAGGYIQWRYIGEATWTNLIALTTLTGPTGDAGADGEDGREVEFRVDSGYIQWRYVGDAAWTNLIALNTLVGPQGPAGIGLTNRGIWVSGTDYEAGDYVFYESSADANVNSMWICQLEILNSTTQPKNDLTHWVEFEAPRGEDGEDGREIELQVAGGYIQWRYVGDVSWINLIALSALVGPAGADGQDGSPGADGDDGREIELQVAGGYIQWRYVGDVTWINLIALSALVGPAGAEGQDGSPGADGDDGREIELQVAGGYIQWRYVGDASWINLIALTAITGPTGADGQDGNPGVDGEDGREIELQVAGGYIQWRYVGDASWINLIALSALVGPAGAAGQDGDDGREIELRVAGGYIQWRYVGSATWINLITLTAITGPAGAAGADGQDGTEIELRNNAGYIQWRYVDTATWYNLIEVASLKGDKGDTGDTGPVPNHDWQGTYLRFELPSGFWGNAVNLKGDNGADGREIELAIQENPYTGAYWLRWRYVGSATWYDLVNMATLAGPAGAAGDDGADGREIELRVDSGYIQWRYVGDATWTNLIALTELTGPPGSSSNSGWFTYHTFAVKGDILQADKFPGFFVDTVNGADYRSIVRVTAGTLSGSCTFSIHRITSASNAKVLPSSGSYSAGVGGNASETSLPYQITHNPLYFQNFYIVIDSITSAPCEDLSITITIKHEYADESEGA